MRARVGAILVGALCLTQANPTEAATRLPGLRSPSGNITCLLVPRQPHLLCQIAHASYAAALQARCSAPPTGLDWHGFELGATGRATIVCSGGILYDPDTQRPAYVTLPYGQGRRLGVFTCLSRLTGVTCRSESGHGLFVSRESWRAW